MGRVCNKELWEILICTINENLFYKIGIDKYLEYGADKIINARTIPTQFTLKLKGGNSLSMYLEHQMKEDLGLSERDYYVYLSPSYNILNLTIVNQIFFCINLLLLLALLIFSNPLLA